MPAPGPPEPARTSPGAVALVSGGLDSAVALAIARRDAGACWALSVDYGQRHAAELHAARAVAAAQAVARHVIVPVDLRAIGGSALTADLDVPKSPIVERETAAEPEIPVTYVPARNLLFLSVAVGLAEVAGAQTIYLGVNAVDYSGYPDCRPAFVQAFQAASNLGTKAGVEGRGVEIRTPLIDKTKAEIIRLGLNLGVDFSLTRSCYDPDEAGRACGRCDSCRIRRRGFEEAGAPDPTIYAPQTGG